MGNNADDKGGTSMREHNILTAPVEFLDILELQRGKKSTSMGGWFCQDISQMSRRKNIWGC